MKTMRKVEIKFSGERITKARVLEDGSCELVVEIVVNEGESEVVENMEQSESLQELDENVFVLVEASKLSLDDKFMKHNPTTAREKEFKELLTKVIRKGIKDFYRPKYDPSFNGDGTGVTFKAGNKPAVGKSDKWWKKVAKEFMPERHSRLGTKSEYVAFLGVLIKKLVEDEKWSVAKAWDAVCNNSKELGHYWESSEDVKHWFEDTGMREICGFFDLANAHKIIVEYEGYEGPGVFLLAGGSFFDHSYSFPLACLFPRYFINLGSKDSVGWFVLS